MATDRKRLRRLLDVQDKLKAVHETRHADYAAKTAAAQREVADLFAEMGKPDSFSRLFPDLYVRAARAALQREHRFKEKTREEAAAVAMETARTRMVEEAWRSAKRQEDRKEQEKEILEAVERRFHTGKTHPDER
ncbi:MAG: hypothetical protein EPN45_00920 [Rhizobiaceae bacterium]|nr:MAG: hypothetical protein EPN45_00920 [Rhizobiaceae bacterium]